MRKHVRNLVVALTLAPLCAFADDEGSGSGFFVGLNTGYAVGFTKMVENGGQGQQTTTTGGTTAPEHINIGVRLGYSYYFMDFLGFRGYLDYVYGFNHTRESSGGSQNQGNTHTDTNKALHHVTLNVDALVNIFNSDSVSFGAFVGIGLGYEAMSSTNNEQNTNTVTQVARGFALPINVGLSLTAGGHHRFEFGVKIPTLGIKAIPEQGQGNNQTSTTTYRNLITQIGYSYIF